MWVENSNLLVSVSWNNVPSLSPYPERPELREQHGDSSAEAAAGSVLLDVQVLQARDLGSDGVHVFESDGHTQRQPVHAGRDGRRVDGEGVSTWEDGNTGKGHIKHLD